MDIKQLGLRARRTDSVVTRYSAVSVPYGRTAKLPIGFLTSCGESADERPPQPRNLPCINCARGEWKLPCGDVERDASETTVARRRMKELF